MPKYLSLALPINAIQLHVFGLADSGLRLESRVPVDIIELSLHVSIVYTEA